MKAFEVKKKEAKWWSEFSLNWASMICKQTTMIGECISSLYLYVFNIDKRIHKVNEHRYQQ